MKISFETNCCDLFVIPYLCFIDNSWDDLNDESWGFEIGWLYWGINFAFNEKKEKEEEKKDLTKE